MHRRKEVDPLLKISSLNLLSQIARDDETAIQMKVQGAKSLCKVLCQLHPGQLGSEASEAAYEIQLYTFKCLRFIYSVERNRKIFRKLFPSSVFGPFVDVGNYIEDIGAYQGSIAQFNSLSVKYIQTEELRTLENNVSMLREANSQPLKVVGGYSLIEVIVSIT
jgi:NIMA (never in mitosis gene a)-related kinase